MGGGGVDVERSLCGTGLVTGGGLGGGLVVGGGGPLLVLLLAPPPPPKALARSLTLPLGLGTGGDGAEPPLPILVLPTPGLCGRGGRFGVVDISSSTKQLDRVERSSFSFSLYEKLTAVSFLLAKALSCRKYRSNWSDLCRAR